MYILYIMWTNITITDFKVQKEKLQSSACSCSTCSPCGEHMHVPFLFFFYFFYFFGSFYFLIYTNSFSDLVV